MVTNEPTSPYDAGDASEESRSAGRPRGSVVANAKKRQSGKLTPHQERMFEQFNDACWGKGWVAKMPSGLAELEKMLKQY